MSLSKSHYIIPIFVPHGGCPHSCVFCNQSSITGESSRVTADYAREIIEEYLKTIPSSGRTVEISFFGGTFTAININKQRELLAVAKEYKESEAIDYIRLSTRPDYIDKEILEHLKFFSVDIIELGIQSMDDEVLKKAGRGHSKDDVIRASELIKEYGITLGHQFMLGLPGDTFEKDISTVEQIIKLKPSMCRIYPSLVIKGTAMEKLYNDGKYEPYSLEKAVEIAKLMYCKLSAAGIKVIRIGLQPTDTIALDGDIVAGPFHPAFRELVEGSLYCEAIRGLLIGKRNKVRIEINGKDISKLYTNKKQFFIDMSKQLNTINLQVVTNNNLPQRHVCLSCEDKCIEMSIDDYILKKSKEGNINNL